MDHSPAVGLTRRQWSRRAPAARPHRKEASVESVEPAGQNQLKIYHMENTKQIIYCRFCDRLTTEEVEEINKKSIDEVSSTEDCEDCRDWK